MDKKERLIRAVEQFEASERTTEDFISLIQATIAVTKPAGGLMWAEAYKCVEEVVSKRKEVWGGTNWCSGDIISEAKQRGYPELTEDQIDDIASTAEQEYKIIDRMVEAGWECIHMAIRDVLGPLPE